MAVTIEVDTGKSVTITGPAKVVVTVDHEDQISTSGGDGGGAGSGAAPEVNELAPDTAVSGGPDVTMIVDGTGFTADSVIVFDGHDEPTTFISDTQVSTGVKPSLFVVPAECPVSVRNGAQSSNELTFTFTAEARSGHADHKKSSKRK
jgi:hypothetical protein